MTAAVEFHNPLAAVSGGAATTDRIRHVKLYTLTLPLQTPISDAKVLTGRQKPMTEIVFFFAEITTEAGHNGIGFSYSKRAGGPAQYAHADEIADELIGEDPNDIGRLWTKLLWAGASVGRSGVATQAIAASTSHCGTSKPNAPTAPRQTARRVPRFGAGLQHLRRLPADGSTRSRERPPNPSPTVSAASRSRSASPTP